VNKSLLAVGRSERQSLVHALLYLVPSIIIFVAFVFYPLVKSFLLSLHQTDLMGVETVFIGGKQYVDLFTVGHFSRNIWLTLLFALGTVIPSTMISLVLAYMANWRLKGMAFFHTVFASPLVIAVASASMIWMMLYNSSTGVLNYLLSQVGMSPVKWLTDPNLALLSLIIVAIWRSLGFNTIILLSGLQSIPESLYESARLDGAGPWRLFKDITLPLVSPKLFFVFVVSMINALQTFGEINILTQGGPVGATDVMVYSIYREAFFNFNYGFASAQAIVLFFIIFALTLLQFLVLERKVFYR
jgi:sn-glycerol 3-phosphate transport system permease protein